MHHRDKYKNFAESHKTGQDWPFWKVVFAGWLIRAPLRTIKFFLGLIVFIGCVAYEFVPENTQKNLGGQNTTHRSY